MGDVSGVVLAGGLSRRLGRDKAMERVGGERLISRVTSRLRQIADELVVVVADEARAASLPLPPSARGVVDIYPGAGALGGLFTGLTAAACQWGIVVACDMPFLNLGLLRHLLDLRPGWDAAVPVLGGRPEPIHAVYSKACLPSIEKRLKARDFKIISFFPQVRVRLVPEDEVAVYDPCHLSFFNVNTQEDLDRAAALAAEGR